jgi:hypothetical protein
MALGTAALYHMIWMGRPIIVFCTGMKVRWGRSVNSTGLLGTTN